MLDCILDVPLSIPVISKHRPALVAAREDVVQPAGNLDSQRPRHPPIIQSCKTSLKTTELERATDGDEEP